MRLIDAPVGVFRFDNELVLKTEYSKKYGSVYCPECYILSSGERFWGGMETIEDFETKFNYLEVESVNVNIKSGQESTIQFEPHYDEWCHSCKEYDKEKHFCPRWNKVIKSTVEELKSAQTELANANANKKCGYKPDCPWSYGGVCSSPNDHSYNECDYDRGIFPDGYEPKSKT